MECDVDFTAKSMRLRYKLLLIENEHYLINSDQPIWVMFIQFAYWLMPHTVYKVSDQEVLEQIKSPTVKQEKASFISIFGIGMTVLLSKLLESISGYLEFQTQSLLGIIIFLFMIISVISLRLYISKVNQRNLQKVVNLSNLQKKKLWIRPESAEYLIVYSLLYPFFTLLTAAAIYGYFKIGDIILLICGIVLMFGLFYGNVLTMKQGTTKVKFKQEKHAI